MKIKERLNKQNILILLIIILMCSVMVFFQTKKQGYHEDESYTLVSAVNPDNGLMSNFENGKPVWKTKEYIEDYVTLSKDNNLNLISVYTNQAKDNHPPIFYILVHFSSMLFGGKYSIYSVFIVNIIAFILSCLVIKKLLKTINKENIIIAILLLYGLCMGTISMVIYQRMYMLLTLFVLLYFYYNVKIYKNNFEISRLDIVKLGLITIGGFLTQYFFVVYAATIFIMMSRKMVKENKKEYFKKYVIAHVVYAILGIVLFPPCIYHLLFTGRGVKNLGNHNYFSNFGTYIKFLEYAFSTKTSTIILFVFLIFGFERIARLHEKKEERFIVLLASIPTAIFFIITVKMTSFQELRYIMPMIPFIVIILYVMLDTLIDMKYKNVIFIGISIFFIGVGFIFSKPQFLYENYTEILKIAEENQEKSFVYVYDNYFNHMQSIPEMMIYEKTLIINYDGSEFQYLINNEQLNNETSYILSIKSYMNNEEILEKIKNETEFKKITEIYRAGKDNLSNEVGNNLYLVSK